MFFRFTPLALAAALLLPFASAQTKRPMTFEDLQAMKRLGETAVSADGQWLAYAVTTVNLDQNSKTTESWLQKIAGGEPVKLAALLPGDSGLQFSADDKQILFLSSRSGSQQIWLASFDPSTGQTGAPRQLTNLPTEADRARWAPNGQFIVFTSAVYPDCPAITLADAAAGNSCNAARDKEQAESKVKARIFTSLLYRHWNAFTGEKKSHLFQVLVGDGTLRDLTPNDPRDVPPWSIGGDGGFDIAPDSRELVLTENPDQMPAISTSAQIYTLDLTNPAAKPVKISTSAGGNFNPAYSPDGHFVAWRSQERAGYEADKFRLMLYDRAAKTTRDLLPTLDNWVDEFAWSTDSQSLTIAVGQTGRVAAHRVGLDGAIRELTLHAEFSGLLPLPDGNVVATRMSVQTPSELFLISAQKGVSPRPLSHLNDALLSQLDLQPMKSYWFEAADKTKVQGFVIAPPAFDPQKKYPVKFLIHGGPQSAWGDAWSYRWNAELLAANGYAVVMVNPRGSTGYGQAFVDGVNGEWGGKPFTDLMEGLDAAEKQFPFLDKSRECALGASYGGFMANWILGHTTRFRCIVSHDGMYNPDAAYGQTEELWFNEWEFKGTPWDYTGKPDAENPFRKWSPALSAKNFKTPTLVIHGQLDYRLDVAQGFELFTALQRQKVPSKVLYFPDEGHWVLKPQNSRLWYKTVNEWVDQWTK